MRQSRAGVIDPPLRPIKDFAGAGTAHLAGGTALRAVWNVLSGLSVSEWLGLGSAFVAVFSFLLSRKTVRRQEIMQFEAFRAAHDAHLIAWADRAIQAISDAQQYCRDLKNGILAADEAQRSASGLRTRLTAILDQGRLFFPNQPESDAEEGERPSEAAYIGAEQPAIDALYQIYRVIADLGRASTLSPAQAVTEVVKHRRRFVSEVFVSIDPRRRQAALSELSSKSAAKRTR